MTQPIESVTIATKNLDLPARLVVPPGAEDGPAPGLVVLHDSSGLDDATLQTAIRLAGLGYSVIAPDLFARSGGPKDTSDKGLLDFTLSLFDSQIIGDVLAALHWLAARDDVKDGQLGVVGWGWGGAYALMAAAHDARIRAVADIGGHITYPLLTAPRPGSPLNFVADIEGAVFAAYPENDPTIPRNEIERMSSRLIEHDRIGEVKVYPNTTARFWLDDSLPQTAALWRRLENFLRDNISGPDEEAEPLGDYPNEQSRLHA